eukprot:2789474-Amphidinium_carterae.1
MDSSGVQRAASKHLNKDSYQDLTIHANTFGGMTSSHLRSIYSYTIDTTVLRRQSATMISLLRGL